jgi:hypothetical protein
MNLRNIFRMADSNPFQDMAMPVHWDDGELFDDMYKVGRVVRTLAGDQLGWMADPYWNEDQHFFDTEEEAKAWLTAMYKMGDGNGAKLKRRVRPAAK